MGKDRWRNKFKEKRAGEKNSHTLFLEKKTIIFFFWKNMSFYGLMHT